MTTRARSSLRAKVTLIILVTCAVALAAVIAAFVAYEYADLRQRTVLRVGVLARVTGDNCRSALAFHDEKTAEETLGALAADPRILGAALYDQRGGIFARYERAGARVEFPAAPPPAADVFAPHRLTVTRPVLFRVRTLGTILVICELAALEQQVAAFARLGAQILLVTLLVASLLALRLQRLVTAPVLRLAAAAREVAQTGDYSARVAPESADEIGVLTEDFNQMLARVQSSDAALRESESRYAVAVAGARDGIWDWRLASGSLYFSPRFKAMLGHADDEIGDSLDEWSERVHPEDLRRVWGELEDHLAGRVPSFESEYRMRHRDGHWVWVFVRGLASFDETGRAIRIAGSLTDVTERRGRDPLTGLPNRLLFEDRVERALERARYGRARHFAVLLVDLERLQTIVRAHGQAAGRELLVAAAERIRGAIQARDTVARLETSGFGILLEEAAEPAWAARAAERVQAALRPEFRIAGQDLFTDSAVGIALSSTGHEHVADLLRDAEAALERARQRGWNRFEVYDESVRAAALARLALENELRRAVERGALELHFQPIVRVDGERLAGFEALARWRREGGGQVPAHEFIPLAEETGIIVPLGSWVLRRALGQLREWSDAAGGRRDLLISVNVSARQLSRIELIDEVRSALDDNNIPAASLKLEITESSLVQDYEPAGAILRELSRQGVGFWLDDFGTGYSSLAYLHHFPLEALKIDRSFVTAVEEDSDRRQIVRTIVALARALRLKSVAEGVETHGQLERLGRLRCDYAQGHLVSLPLGDAAVTQMLRGLAAPVSAR